MSHILTTERLTLRPVTHEDHATLLTHWIDPDIRRFLFDDVILSSDQITQAIEDSARNFTASGYGLWLIHHMEGAELVGTAGLRPLDDLGLEVIYSLAPGTWGYGYATEAARAVVDHALDTLRLPEILAEIDDGNTASREVANRLGMVPFDVVPGVLGSLTRYRRTR